MKHHPVDYRVAPASSPERCLASNGIASGPVRQPKHCGNGREQLTTPVVLSPAVVAARCATPSTQPMSAPFWKPPSTHFRHGPPVNCAAW